MSETETEEQEGEPPEIKRRHAFDLENLGVEELTALRDAAEARRRKLLDHAKNDLLREFREKLRSLGLTIDAVLPSPARGKGAVKEGGEGRRKRRDAGQPLPVKFRGPSGETWSGRGRERRASGEMRKMWET